MNVRVIASLAATGLLLLGDSAMAQQSRVTISTAPNSFQAGENVKNRRCGRYHKRHG